MSDRRRIVSLPSGVGSPTTLLDLENGSTYQAVKDSFVVTPGARKTTMAAQPRRYAGSRPVAETHDNGTVEWKMLVSGATVTTVVANVEALLTQVESVTGLFLEWRPDGATSSTYYELRGSPSWKPSYSWAQMQGAGSMYVDLSFPVAPLAWGDKYTISPTRPATAGSPAYYVLPAAITGDAPALVDLNFTASGAKWGLVSWMPRPATPVATTVAPFGVIEGEAASTLTGLAVTANAAMHGGSYAAVTTSGASTASALWKIDPSVLTPDTFKSDTCDVEIWARLTGSGGYVQGLTATASMYDTSGANNARQYTREFGSSGKSIGNGPAIQGLYRLGVITMPLNTGGSNTWVLRLFMQWTGVSAGTPTLGLDYLLLVPARQRACSPTGKTFDSTYPNFVLNSGASRPLYSDLSGGPVQAGLGGSPIEVAPGNTDFVFAQADLVPDIDTEVAMIATPTVLTLTVTPRYWLAKGT